MSYQRGYGTPNPTYHAPPNRHNDPRLAQQQNPSNRNLGYSRPPQPQHPQQSHTHQYYYPPQPQPSAPPPNPYYQQQPSPYQPHPQHPAPYPPSAPPPPQSQPPHSRYAAQPYAAQQPHGSYQGYPPGAVAHAHAAHPGGAFTPSGRRKALLVGINYRGTSAELHGCVRDVTFVHHLLTSKFGFRNTEFVVLTDDPVGISGVRRGSPTRRTILDSLRWLVADTRPGDSLWFSFSGHGSQVRDTSGDESDGYDETILPVDYKKSGHIIDDELYDIVRRITRGSRLTVLLDACHSGTGLDLPYQHDVFGTGSGQKMSGYGKQQSFKQGLMGVAGALLNGNPSGALSAGLNLATGKKKKPAPGPDPNYGEVLLFSGCKDNQTSADTSKLTGGLGLTTGAMTYALIETLEHSTVGDWRNYTYRKLLKTMRDKLRNNKMTQTPQFSTSHSFNLDSLFVL